MNLPVVLIGAKCFSLYDAQSRYLDLGGALHTNMYRGHLSLS